jgi:hypothetical protein
MSQRCRFCDVVYRLFVAAVGGLAVAGTAYLCAYFDQRGQFEYRVRELSTQRKLDSLQAEIERHRRTTGRLPTNLAELEAVKRYHQFTVDAEGRVTDMWDHPYQYQVEGEGFELYSLGSDGQPGGVGRDADLYPSSAGRPPELPTFRQFTFDLPTEGVQRTCIVAGVCAALVCLLVTRNRRGADLLARAAATVIVSFLIAIAITSLQIPSGQ